MFIYEVVPGTFWNRGADGIDKLVGKGYSGADGITKNNPEYQDIHDEGPIPKGTWQIQGPPIDTSTHGPFVLHLFPEPNTLTFGRTGFLIHGDSKLHPGKASEGCIILPLPARQAIWAAISAKGDPTLKVIDKFADSSDTKDTKGDLV